MFSWNHLFCFREKGIGRHLAKAIAFCQAPYWSPWRKAPYWSLRIELLSGINPRSSIHFLEKYKVHLKSISSNIAICFPKSLSLMAGVSKWNTPWTKNRVCVTEDRSPLGKLSGHFLYVIEATHSIILASCYQVVGWGVESKEKVKVRVSDSRHAWPPTYF